MKNLSDYAPRAVLFGSDCGRHCGCHRDDRLVEVHRTLDHGRIGRTR